MLDYDNSKSIEFTELCTYFGYYADGEEMSDWSDPATSPQPSDGSRRRPGAADREAESNMPTESDSRKAFSYRRDHPLEPGVAPVPAGRRTREDYALFCEFAGATTQTLTTNLAAGAPKLTALEVINIFKTLDTNGDGEISHAEFIRGCKSHPSIADKLGVPTGAHAQDNRSLQLAFGKLDLDKSKSIDVMEILGYYGHLGQDETHLQSLLMLCGYDGAGIRKIFSRARKLSGSDPQTLASSSWQPPANGTNSENVPFM
jgi:Ca2+-binding EF-hand superfamily protein